MKLSKTQRTVERKIVFRFFYYISIALTALLAVITLLGAFALYVSPRGVGLLGSTVWLPFIGLALPVLLLINLVVALYWSVRWRCWVILPLMAIAGNWGYLTRIYQLGSAAPEQDATAETILTVATYNVDSFGSEQRGYTCKAIAAYLKSQQADVLCFQEFGGNHHFTADSIKAAFADWPYSFIPHTPDSIALLQLAVFSKYPIRGSRLITYPGSRNCTLWCDLDVNGKPLRLFNNHLQTTEVTRNKRKLAMELQQEAAQVPIDFSAEPTTSNSNINILAAITGNKAVETALWDLLDGLHQNFIKRAEQADTLRSLISASPHPTLVCGDFNSLPSSYTYATVKGDHLKDGFQTCGHGYMYTYHHFKHLLRIDYILHSKALEGVDYFSPELEYSDHNPVVMRVKMK